MARQLWYLGLPWLLLSPVLPAQAQAPATQAPSQEGGYTVKPGDILAISVWKEPDLQRPALVRPDGAFSFPLVGEVDARGKTVAELNKLVKERLGRFISQPEVTVSVQEVKGNKVYVIGQVTKPGEFIVNPRVDVMQALSMAGGTTPFAALGDITILRRQGTKQIALPFRYTEVARGRNLQQNIELESGDVVVVP
jgi:polysaccharide export outer membrane protein